MINTKSGILFILTITATLCLSACSSKEDEQSSKITAHLSRAEAYLEQGQYRSAIIEVRNISQLEKDHFEGQLLTARIFNTIGQPNQALKILESLPNQTSESVVLVMADTYILKGKFKSALNILQKLPEINHTAEYFVAMGRAQSGLSQLEQAELSFQQALKIDPNKQSALLGIARIKIKEINNTEAAKFIEQILAINKSNPEALFLKAGILSSTGDLEGTEALLSEIISILPATDITTPLRSKTLQALVGVLTKQGRSNEALIYTQILKESMPGVAELKTKLIEALEAFKNKELTKAETLFKEVLELSPQNEIAGTMLGTINYLQGDLSGAESYFSEFVDPETASTVAVQTSAMTNLRMNQPEKVISMLQDSIEGSTNTELLSVYGMAALSANKTQQGLDAINKALTLEPSKARLHLIIVNYLNLKDPADHNGALTEVNKAFEKAPQDVQIQRALLKQHILMKNPEKAEQTITEILDENKNSVGSQILASGYYQSIGNISSSRKHLEQAIKLDPENEGTLSIKARTELIDKDYSGSQKTFEKIISLNAENIAAYKGLITSYELLKNADAGIARVKSLAETKGNSLAPIAVLVEYYTRKKNIESALNQLEKLKLRNPNTEKLASISVSVYAVKAQLALKDNKPEIARTALLEALQLKPDAIPLLQLLVNTEIKAERYTEANKIIDQISKLDPEGITAPILSANLAEVKQQATIAESIYRELWDKKSNTTVAAQYYAFLMRQTKTDDANTFLNEWIAASPDAQQPRMLLAMSEHNSGNMANAVANYEKIVRTNPTSFIALNNLAWIYDQNKDPRAVETAKKAYSNSPPNNAAVMDTYGWILAKNNRAREGIKLLKKAAELAPQSVEIQDHLQQALKM